MSRTYRSALFIEIQSKEKIQILQIITIKPYLGCKMSIFIPKKMKKIKEHLPAPDRREDEGGGGSGRSKDRMWRNL